MSYELYSLGTATYRTVSRQSWAKVLELGRIYGWRPMGTTPPSEHDSRKLGADWDGAYLTNDGQTVDRADAFALAEALQRSLDDIPDFGPEPDWNPKFWREDDLPEWLSPDERALIEDGLEGELLDVMGIHPFEFFAGQEKGHLIEIIRFCRLGSFIIS